MSTYSRWWSPRMEREIGLQRWGSYGTPVLLFPAAGGEAGEVERMGLVDACAGLIDAGRITIYSCDSTAGQALLARQGSPEHRMWLFNAYQECVRHEVVPAVHADSRGPLPLVTAGAALGAYHALAVTCRYPDAFRAAVCMSGTYEIERFFDHRHSADLYLSSAVQFLPGVDGAQLQALRERFAVIATGSGPYEDVPGAWRAGEALGSKGVPNRVDVWGPEWAHDWPTWHRMLPQYLEELC